MSEDPPSLAAVPRAAAVAGVAFALLFGAALLMVRLSIPGSIVERGGWLADPAGNHDWALHAWVDLDECDAAGELLVHTTDLSRQD